MSYSGNQKCLLILLLFYCRLFFRYEAATEQTSPAHCSGGPHRGLPPVLGRRLLRSLRPRKPAAAPAQLPAASPLALA